MRFPSLAKDSMKRDTSYDWCELNPAYSPLAKFQHVMVTRLRIM